MHNLRLYPLFQVSVTTWFWLPVFFLFFAERLSLDQVLRLEAIYYLAVVLLEVPSGWFSDAVGRRLTLIISALGLLGSYVLFFAGATIAGLTDSTVFAMYAAAQVSLAAGMAFMSGTAETFHYESLQALGREDEYAEREARVVRWSALSSALGALAGGAVASLGLRWAYGLSIVAALAALVVAMAMTEPARADEHARPTLASQMRACLGHLADRTLRWLFVFALTAYMLNHVPYHVYQPYVKLLVEGSGLELDVNATPLLTGALTAATMLGRSAAAKRSVGLAGRLGLRRALLLSLGLQLAIIVVCGAVLHAVIVLVLLARSVPSGLQAAPLSAAIIPRLQPRVRATYLSVQTLAGRLGYSGLLLGMSFLVGTSTPVTWPGLSTMCWASAAFGAAMLVVLAVSGKLKAES